MRRCSSERISYPPGEELKRGPAQKRKKLKVLSTKDWAQEDQSSRKL